MPDPTSRIQFSSVFSKEGMDHIVQDRSGSDVDGVVSVWTNTSGPEARRCAGTIWPGFWQDATGPVSGRTQPARYHFPTFRLGSVLPQTSRIILCKTSPDPVYFWLIVSDFGEMDPVRKQAGEQQSSGPLPANASHLIRTGFESDPACLLGLHFSHSKLPA